MYVPNSMITAPLSDSAKTLNDLFSEVKLKLWTSHFESVHAINFDRSSP